MDRTRLQEHKPSLVINMDDLDEELIQYPSTLEWAGVTAAMAVSVRDVAKNSKDLVSADAENQIRAYNKDTGNKVTESAVKMDVDLNPAVRSAMDKYLAAKLAADESEAYYQAMIAKGKMLEQLAKLLIARGGATDKAYANIKKDMAEKRQATT